MLSAKATLLNPRFQKLHFSRNLLVSEAMQDVSSEMIFYSRAESQQHENKENNDRGRFFGLPR